MGKWLPLGPWQEMHEVSPNHPVVPDSKEATQGPEGQGHGERTWEPTRRGPAN